MYDLLLINHALELKRDRGSDFVFPWIESGHGWIPLPTLFLAPYCPASLPLLLCSGVGARRESPVRMRRWLAGSMGAA